MSLKTKSILLSFIVTAVISGIGGFGIYSIDRLNESRSLSATKNIFLVDKMHEGVRAAVYRSLLSKTEELPEIHKELRELSEGMKTQLKELNKSAPAIDKFLADADGVLTQAAKGDKILVDGNLKAFAESHALFEKDFAAVRDTVESEAKTRAEAFRNEASDLRNLAVIMVCVGVIFALGISIFAYRFMSGLTSNIMGITQHLKGQAGDIHSSANSIVSVSTKLSEASTEQAASLQETVASIDEISAMVHRNAESALTSSRISEESTQIVKKGKEITEQMVNSITSISDNNDEIIQEMQKSNAEISEIVKVIENIGLKTKVINDIVFQTKLLSFNASVEAARAGEHGKGFSVVAEEVGNLASMSGKAATEITEILTMSVDKVTGIVDNTKSLMDNLITKSRDKVNSGRSTAVECASALDEILSKVTSVNLMVKEIATASQEQSVGVNEINKAMSELDQVTQSNSNTAEEASKAANDLQKSSESLNKLVLELSHVVGGDLNAKEAVKSVAKPKTKPVLVEKKSHDLAIVPKVKALASVKTEAKVEKVVPIKAATAKKVPVSTAKKVVGLQTVPDNDDPRFEDV